MTTKKGIIKKIEKEREKIKSKGVKKIGLFGSFVRGKQHKRSDIDIIVEFDEPSFDNYAELLILLENWFKRRIDLVTKNSLRPELKYVITEAEYVKL